MSARQSSDSSSVQVGKRANLKGCAEAQDQRLSGDGAREGWGVNISPRYSKKVQGHAIGLGRGSGQG